MATPVSFFEQKTAEPVPTAFFSKKKGELDSLAID
jgi:hypothetical protein